MQLPLVDMFDVARSTILRARGLETFLVVSRQPGMRQRML